jgi:ATP-binding cassette subfamily B (MDR/TAP) protein 1
MLGRYEKAASKPATIAAAYANEMIDSVKTVAALGRERETMRLFNVKTGAVPKQWRHLILGSAGFGLVHGTVLCMSSLLFYWSSRRLASGVVRNARFLLKVHHD